MLRWWHGLSTQDRIAIVGLLVAVLGVLPGYLALRATGGAERPDPAVTRASGLAESHKPALKPIAQYNWTSTHVMWALPEQLSPEESRLAQQRILGGPRQDSAIASLEALLARRGGVKIDFVDTREGIREDSELRLIIEGQHGSPVLITRMYARVLKRQSPLSEVLFFGPPEGQGEDIQIGFDLDSTNPVARILGNDGHLGEPYFATKHVTVKRGEQVVFGIKGFADGCYCEWEIVIDAIVDGQNQMFTVKDGSRPFRTTGFTDTYGTIYELDIGEGRFVRLPPGSRREYFDGRMFFSKR
jgi:hypothetical protein